MHSCMHLADESRCSVWKCLHRAAADTCVAVFHFPQLLTATAWCASGLDEAAHSLRADMAISLPIIAAGNAMILSAGFSMVSNRCTCAEQQNGLGMTARQQGNGAHSRQPCPAVSLGAVT